MSDLLTSWLVADTPVEREVSLGVKAHFRRISAGEKAQLVKGQKVHTQAGSATTMEFDVAESMHTKHLLVAFSVCKPDGSRFFKNVGAVEQADALKVNALYRIASEVNREDDEPGKS